MQSTQALQKTSETTRRDPVFVEAEKLFGQMKEISQNIASRAFAFFEDRGRELGHDLEDWFRAEFELLRSVPMEMRQTDTQFIVRAEIPGFSAPDIKINAEAGQLTVTGKIETPVPETGEEVFSEFRPRQFYRRLRLPAEIDPDKVSASLKDGVLEITLTRIIPRPVNIEVKTV